MRAVLDIEANGLLDETTIDYTQSPYRLKDTFKIWCICVIDYDTKQEYSFVGDYEIRNKFPEFSKQFTKIIAHNAIDYDLLVLSLYLGLTFDIEVEPKAALPDLFDGRPVEIEDTLVLSRVYNPDRYPGHSLAVWGEKLGTAKTDWRAEAIELGLITREAEKGAEFQQWHPRMLDYCLQDCRVTLKLSAWLSVERGDWDWADAVSLEKSVAWIITKQSHRGFDFDSELAYANIIELDSLMLALKEKVEPHLPPKPMGKTKLKDFIPPKKQFLKSGEIRQQAIDWVTKHGGSVEQVGDSWIAHVFDKTWTLPLPDEPLVTHEPTTLSDSSFIKGFLLEMGWNATNWKERDLTVGQKKHKLSQEKFEEAVHRYVNSTLGTPTEKERCEHIGVSPEYLLTRLLAHDIKKPLKVLTNPSYTVGQDKELCQGLVKLSETFPYAKDIADYLTYNHRRNSLLSKGASLEDFEDEDCEEVHKGFLAYARDDGRISTPANPCGCATSRMSHRKVCNIPRNTSLYGEKMRKLFGAGSEYYLIGYDADGLENRIKAHYVHKYAGGPAYGEILCAPKPHDIHWYNQTFIKNKTDIDISRDNTKATAYALDYGAQPPKLAKTLSWSIDMANMVFNAYWEAAGPLKALKEDLVKFWETTGQKKFIKGLDGRKIPVRSKHSIINFTFQSGGLIAMKRAMVIHDKWMKERGWLCDFFKEDWKNRKYFAQQLIAMHDESQIEVTKDLVKFKIFNTEEEAKAFKIEGKVLSSVGHAPDGRSYRAYSEVGELASKAVEEASRYYNMNIKLSAGYAVAKRWSDTH